MVRIITIRTSGDIKVAVATLDRIKKKINDILPSAIMRWGKILERDMKTSVRRAGIKMFTGELMGRGIRWDQRKKGKVGHLFIRVYGIYLDSMRPHFVSVIRRRTTLLLWAKGGARNSEIIEKAWLLDKGVIKRFSIFVRPHPFIRIGWRTARPKLNPIMKSELKRSIKNA